MIEIFLSAFVGLFVIADPLGTSAVFVSLTAKADKKHKRIIAFKAATIAFCLLVCFGLFGEALLHHMGISLDAFRIAGGLLLFVTAFRMIMGERSSDSSSQNDANARIQDLHDLAIYPLAVPLLSGPGCMTTTVLLISTTKTVMEELTVFTAIFLVELLAFIAMIGATHVSTLVGKTGNSIISKLMGVLLAALAVQFIADGILNITSIPR